MNYYAIADGNGNQASISNPIATFFDSNFNILIFADSGLYGIRKMNQTGLCICKIYLLIMKKTNKYMEAKFFLKNNFKI